ncbi:MAG: class I SAM-dependent methyltransferase [Heliobacteriaceae bacterium]|nr:class I SAM-dependent methyltransferase [Heliobacteriaceae bacterium]
MSNTGITLIVTTSKPNPGLESQAIMAARHLGVPYIPRGQHSLAFLRQEYGCSHLLVLEREGLVLRFAGGEFFFHPNMASLRILALQQGRKDNLVEALQLHPGDFVLDCTLGLGADALVIAYAVGNKGAVTAIESSPLIAFLVATGLAKPGAKLPAGIAEAMQRIQVVQGDHRDLLSAYPDQTFDVVYFDPMFRQPIATASGLCPLRHLADHRPVDPEVIKQARRVAKRRVVLKENRQSPEWGRLNPNQIIGGRHATLAYGVWEGRLGVEG